LFIGSVIAYALYVLFWVIQFAGLTQMEQGKFLFEKLGYEITSQQILIKLNTKQGMPVKWEQIKKVVIGKNHYLFYLSKVQLIHLPFRVFNSENERKFLETILKRKGLIK
ncbi:MAG: YcxB family protein, partial [Cyclobacteriaceae bacterium]|nr:YcxB family protein [Cyclobacteriaceae bacterium]